MKTKRAMTSFKWRTITSRVSRYCVMIARIVTAKNTNIVPVTMMSAPRISWTALLSSVAVLKPSYKQSSTFLTGPLNLLKSYLSLCPSHSSLQTHRINFSISCQWSSPAKGKITRCKNYKSKWTRDFFSLKKKDISVNF